MVPKYTHGLFQYHKYEDCYNSTMQCCHYKLRRGIQKNNGNFCNSLAMTKGFESFNISVYKNIKTQSQKPIVDVYFSSFYQSMFFIF